ncbi:hypothetical protein HDV05_002226 [Chytridiales sp. JEL 0842]|nr:hypothetical protein HDV05_002226 [Chytridiales sp. JEL 0842]
MAVFCMLLTSVSSHECSKVFVASDEWKEIQFDECVPAGLHYRINFETGKKEAKRITDESESSRQQFQVQVIDNEIKESNEKEVVHEVIPLKLAPFTLSSANESEVLDNLIKLEDVVGELDDGVQFIKSATFREALRNLFSHEVALIRIHSLRVFGLAVSNNPDAQAEAISHNLLTDLSMRLKEERNSSIVSTIVYALGALVRNNPNYIVSFMGEGGEGVKLLHNQYLMFKHLQPKIDALVLDLVEALGDTKYQGLCNDDDELGAELHSIITHSLHELERIADVKVDWVQLVCQDLPNVLQQHIHDFRLSKEKVGTIYGADHGIEGLFHRCQGHAALVSPETESEYLRRISEAMLQLLLPEYELKSDVLRFLLREFLATRVLSEAVDRISEPSFIYQMIIMMSKQEKQSIDEPCATAVSSNYKTCDGFDGGQNHDTPDDVPRRHPSERKNAFDNWYDSTTTSDHKAGSLLRRRALSTSRSALAPGKRFQKSTTAPATSGPKNFVNKITLSGFEKMSTGLDRIKSLVPDLSSNQHHSKKRITRSKKSRLISRSDSMKCSFKEVPQMKNVETANEAHPTTVSGEGSKKASQEDIVENGGPSTKNQYEESPLSADSDSNQSSDNSSPSIRCNENWNSETSRTKCTRRKLIIQVTKDAENVQSSKKTSTTSHTPNKQSNNSKGVLSNLSSLFSYGGDVASFLSTNWMDILFKETLLPQNRSAEDISLLKPTINLGMELISLAGWENSLLGQCIPAIHSVLHAISGRLINRLIIKAVTKTANTQNFRRLFVSNLEAALTGKSNGADSEVIECNSTGAQEFLAEYFKGKYAVSVRKEFDAVS